MAKIVGLKELREDMGRVIQAVKERGETFVVVRRSKPVFRIAPPEEAEQWETVVNFSRMKKGGVSLQRRSEKTYKRV